MLNSLKKLYSLFDKQIKLKGLFLLFMMIIGAFFEVLGIGIIPAFVAAAVNPDNILKYPAVRSILEPLGMTSPNRILIVGAVFLITIYVIKNAYIAFLHYQKGKFIYNTGIVLGKRLFTAYMAAPYTFHLGRNSAELLRNVNGEIKTIVGNVILQILTIILTCIMIFSIMVLLIAMEPLITIIAVICMGGGSWIFLNKTKIKINNYGIEDLHHRHKQNKAVMQGIGGFKDLRVLNREKYFVDQYITSTKRSAKLGIYLQLIEKLPKSIIETIAISGILLIALILVFQGRDVASIVPILTLFGVATIRLLPMINQLTSGFTVLNYHRASIEPVYDDLMLFERQKYGNWKILSKPVRRLQHKEYIKLDGVTYRYPNADYYSLKNINLTITKGSAVGFVGPTGAGKSTIVDVILGLLEPQEGAVFVDGVEIRKNLTGWQQNIGYIPQFIYLTDDTIRRNIALGIPDEEIDDDLIISVVEAAQLSEFITALSKGLDTVIGERGARISGGQRQRIGIARALYNNPQVLIMDEATSSLDNRTELFIMRAIESLRGNRTIIMIAHRITTVEKCDPIYYMKDGKIDASGTYNELISGNSEFKKMALVE